MATLCPITALYHPLPTADEVREIERDAIESGTSAKELMDRAGRECAAIIAEKRAQSKGTDLIAVLCGPGNNGGDGFIAARSLAERGFKVVTIAASSKRYSDGCLSAARELLSAGAKIHVFPKLEDTQNYSWDALDEGGVIAALGKCTVIVDAIFGIGVTLPAKGFAARLIRLANAERERGVKIFAIDMPSGVSANSGAVTVPAIQADYTLTIQFPKRGLLQWPARGNCGEIVSVPIGLRCTMETEFSLLNVGAVRRIPRRPLDSHKGSYGHVMVLGGTSSMPGAPILASLAALRCGAGLVTKAHLDSSGHILPPEVMLMSASKGAAVLTTDFMPSIKERIETGKITSLVIGPGMGTASETVEFLFQLLDYLGHKKIPYVLDADGLNILATELNTAGTRWKELTLEQAILTPHPLEMARLLGCKVEDVNDDRYAAAKKLASKLKCVVVLKGASSVVYSAKRGFVNSTGNPFMATGGAGDALSGIIAALVAQGFTPLEAACTGTYLHGAAGDYAHESSGSFIIASDIIAAIPRVARVLYD